MSDKGTSRDIDCEIANTARQLRELNRLLMVAAEAGIMIELQILPFQVASPHGEVMCAKIDAQARVLWSMDTDYKF